MTVIDICNMALSALGDENAIASLTETSKQAKLCSLWYESSRLRILAAADWIGIARTTPAIPGTLDSATGLYAYYQRPPENCLRMRAQTPEGDPADIRTSGPAIYSREPYLAFSYVENSDDPDEWPQGVSDAVVCELASRIAYSLTGQRGTASDAAQKARDALSTARADNANLTARQGTENRYAAARRGDACE